MNSIAEKRRKIQFPEVRNNVIQFPVRKKQGVEIPSAPQKHIYLLYHKTKEVYLPCTFCACQLEKEFMQVSLSDGKTAHLETKEYEIKGVIYGKTQI